MSGFSSKLPNFSSSLGKITSGHGGSGSTGSLNITFDTSDLDNMMETLQKLKDITQNMSPLMADIAAKLSTIVDNHFNQERGPHGKWTPRSPMTFLMNKRSRKGKKKKKKK